MVRAGYTKKPLETPGAYELIDEDTGDKFIVWGGTDENDYQAPIPSKEVLHWEPSNDKKKGRSNRVVKNPSEDATQINNSAAVARPTGDAIVFLMFRFNFLLVNNVPKYAPLNHVEVSDAPMNHILLFWREGVR